RDEPRPLCLGHLKFLAFRVIRLVVLEQCADVHTEDLGHLIEPTAPDPIGPILVLLHLLEADAEPVCQLALRHPFAQSIETDVAANDFCRFPVPASAACLLPTVHARRTPLGEANACSASFHQRSQTA